MIARAFAGALALAVALAAGPGPAQAFERAAADSVVSVLRPQPDGGGATESEPPRRGPTQEPEGSAVALAHGLFVTAAHVLGPGPEVLLRLDDGRVFPAKVTARDPATDLAILESPAPARPIQWGDAPILGEQVCAVGNAFGLGISVACGVVSKTDVTHAGFNPIEDFVQTDASINPGMSGGALVDSEGRLVGIVSAIFTKRSDANIGVNFAVSPALTQRVVQALRNDGSFQRPSIGAALEPQPRMQARKHAGGRGARVEPESPAAAAGMQSGDLLTALAGRPVQRPSDAVTALALSPRGGTIEATVRRDGDETTLEIELPDGD